MSVHSHSGDAIAGPDNDDGYTEFQEMWEREYQPTPGDQAEMAAQPTDAERAEAREITRRHTAGTNYLGSEEHAVDWLYDRTIAGTTDVIAEDFANELADRIIADCRTGGTLSALSGDDLVRLACRERVRGWDKAAWGEFWWDTKQGWREYIGDAP